jgi:hypothetical protein
VPLDLPAPHIAILKSALADCLEGLLLDLRGPAPMRNSAQARREAASYERLLTGLDRGEIVVPDGPAREAVAAMAEASDEANNYAEVVAEHEALHGLLGRLAMCGCEER